MREPSHGAMKKPYEPPKLTIYGDLSQMTLLKVSMKGRVDNPSRGNKRTG
jgi:hypothetical protein